MWTTVSLLPLAVFTADCFGVVLQAPTARWGWLTPGGGEPSAGLVARLRD